MEVIELRNPKALLVAEIANLFRRAVESLDFVAPGGFDAVAQDLFKYVASDDFFVLLGVEEGHPKALLLGFYPGDNLFPYPTVTLIYNEGSRGMIEAIKLKLLDILLARGYSAVWAVNSSGKSDRAWERLFRLPGRVSGKPLGTVMEFKVE